MDIESTHVIYIQTQVTISKRFPRLLNTKSGRK